MGPASASDGGWPTEFRRWDQFHPERNLEILVCPHGYAGDLLHEIEFRARRRGFIGPETLEPKRLEEGILSIEPWNRMCTDKPTGYCTGVTMFAAMRWRVETSTASFLADISLVNWCFCECGSDFATSIVAKIAPERMLESAGISSAVGLAKTLMDDLKAWLGKVPVSEMQVAMRRNWRRATGN